jgi:hypothetical protein
VVFRRYLKAGEEITGPPNGSNRLRVELARYGIAGVAYERAAKTWAETVAARERGRGRRPSDRQVERAARRLGLADFSLKEATARLEALAGEREPLDLAQRVQHAREQRTRQEEQV